MLLRRWILAAALPLCALASCGGDDDDDSGSSSGDGDGDGETSTRASSSAGKEEACAEICETFEECEYEMDDCASNCAESSSTSRTGQEALSECLGGLGCEPSELDFLGALTCIPGELEDIELSDAQERYCTESLPAINDCLEGGEAPMAVLGDCEDTIALVSDETIERFNGCASQSCDTLELCVGLELASRIGQFEDFTAEDVSPTVFAEFLTLAVIMGQWQVDQDPFGLDIEDILGEVPGGENVGGAPDQ